MKSDPRVRYTRELIQNTFLQLLREKPVQKITVAEICKAAEINRTTFYRHYQDCYDLLDQLKQRAQEKLQATLETIPKTGAPQALTTILRELKETALEMPTLFQWGEHQFVREVTQRCFAFAETAEGTGRRKRLSEEQQALRNAFLAGGASSAVELWMQNGCREPEDLVAGEILKLCEAVERA